VTHAITIVSKSCAMLYIKTGRHVPKLRSLQLFGEPIQWFDTAGYIPLTLGRQLTWSTHIDQVEKKPALRLGALGPLRKRIRKGVLPYTQLIHPIMDCTFPVWRSAVRYQNLKLQVLQS
jgi:hypothetical protein